MFVLTLFFVTFSFCQFNVIKCKGDHYTCNKKAATEFKANINDVYSNYDTFQKVLIPWYNKHKSDIFKDYVDFVTNYYPQYIDSIKGISDGSGVPFDYVFLLNLENEVRGYLPRSVRIEPFFQHCTDVHVNHVDHKLIGHNEDGPEIYKKNNSYIIDFDLSTKYGHEHIFAFNYAGQIAGNAYGWNSHGFTFSMNAVTPANIQIGAPKFCVNRDVLKASSFDEAIDLTTNVRRAYGHSINIGSINEKKQILIELAPNDAGIKIINGNYSHMNNYRLLTIPFIPNNSSTHRLATMDSLPIPRNEKDVRDRLGNTDDKDWPVYNKGTMSSGVYDLKRKVVDIFNGNPITSEPCQSFSLDFK